MGKGAARLTEQALQKAIQKFLEQKSKPAHGKQTMRQLMKQNAGVSNIEITDSNIKAFESTAKKYNIDFSLKKVKGEQTRYLVFFKGCGKSLRDIQYLCGNIRAGGKPHRLSDFIKEIDKEHIGDIRKYQLFVVYLLHISRPLSIFFTLSRAALSCFALSFAAARALRIEGFFSLFSFFAENS